MKKADIKLRDKKTKEKVSFVVNIVMNMYETGSHWFDPPDTFYVKLVDPYFIH